MTARQADLPGDAALRYAAAGWPVFPVREGGKEPATRHGFKDATTDPDRVAWHWRRQPGANVGIATGAPGPDVVDIDRKACGLSGFATWNEVRRAGLAPSPAAAVRTPGGGAHLYYAGTVQRSGSIPALAIDFRSSGGYVVAPPSAGPGGRRYEVVSHQASAATVDWAAIRGLLEPAAEHRAQTLLHAAHDGPRDVGHLAAWMAARPEGSRNAALFWAACRALEAGDHAALSAIGAAARGTGLTSREITATVRSAQRTARPPFRARASARGGLTWRHM